MKKIPTIFKRDSENMKFVLTEINPLCQWVFEGIGKATTKYDGTCCKIDAQGYWKRREVKRNKPIPDGFVEEEFDPNTGKHFGWIKVSQEEKSDRWHREAIQDLNIDDLEYGTYELVGKRIQGNPMGLEGHTLIAHTSAEELLLPGRDYESIRLFLMDLDIEGIVFHHPDGLMGKIKKRDFKYDNS